VRDQVVALRKRNYSIYDISRVLKEEGTPLGATAVRAILLEEGFAALPRRLDEERLAAVGPTKEGVADVREVSLSPREFTTRVGGLFLFIPDLVRLDTEALAVNANLPGSRMIPEEHALRASLALKLWSIERKSTSWRSSRTRDWGSSAASTPCPRGASSPNTPRASLHRRSRNCWPLGTTHWPGRRSLRGNPSTSTFTACPTMPNIRSSNLITCQSQAVASPAS